jgi:hypothetical protein
MFTYADLMRRLDVLERQLVEIRNILAASRCVPPAVAERRTDVNGNAVHE